MVKIRAIVYLINVFIVIMANVIFPAISYCANSVASTHITRKTITHIEQLFLSIDQLQRIFPFSVTALENIFGCNFITDTGCWWQEGICVISKDLNSAILGQVQACIPNKDVTDCAGKIFLSMKPNTLLTMKEVARYFGKYNEIDTHPCTDMAPEDEPVDYIYRKNWGVLIFECKPKSQIVRQICLNAEQWPGESALNHLEPQPIAATKNEVVELEKTVQGLLPPSLGVLGGMMYPGCHPEVYEYELIGLSKSELHDFVKNLAYEGNADSQLGGRPELSSDESRLIVFRDFDHGPEYFALTFKDDIVSTVQHHVGGFAGDRLPGFIEPFLAQDGPVLNSKESAMNYTLEEKDWQIHSDYYKKMPAAVAYFYIVRGKIYLAKGDWQKAKENFLLAKKRLPQPFNPPPLPPS